MEQNLNDWQIAKRKLELFQGNSTTEQLRSKLVGLAQAGIVHIDSGLHKVISGESSLDDLFRDDPSHDFNHVMRVLKLAENMAIIGGDIDVIRAAVLLHDVVTYAKNAPGARNETEQAAAMTRDLLEGIDFPKEKIEKVVNIISGTSFSQGPKVSSEEASIVNAADKLDQSGAMGIMRYFSSGGQMGRAFFNPEDPFLSKRKRSAAEVFKYTLDALIDRLPRINKSLSTYAIPSASSTFQERNNFFKLFLKELEFELTEAGNDSPENLGKLLPGAMQIMEVFNEAGKSAKIFYDPDDPFCENRKLQPEIYPVDALVVSYKEALRIQRDKTVKDITLNRRIEFFHNYFTELRYELEGEIAAPPRLKITRENWEMVGPHGELEV